MSIYHKVSNRLSTVCTDWSLYQKLLERCVTLFEDPKYKENTIERQYVQFIDMLRYVVSFMFKKQCDVQGFCTNTDNHTALYQQMCANKR